MRSILVAALHVIAACVAVLLLALVPSPVQAETHYRQRHFEQTYGGYGYDQHRQQHRRIVRIVGDVIQINPAYTSSYSPDNYDSTTQSDILAEIRALASRIQTLQAQVAAKQATPMPPASNAKPGPAPPPTVVPSQPEVRRDNPQGGPVVNGLTVLNLKCSSCHQSGKLLPDQKFTLLDPKGNLATLTDKQKLRVMLKVYQGQMPPPNNNLHIDAVSDVEFAALVNLLQPGS